MVGKRINYYVLWACITSRNTTEHCSNQSLPLVIPFGDIHKYNVIVVLLKRDDACCAPPLKLKTQVSLKHRMGQTNSRLAEWKLEFMLAA
jgi:hypothetical protein